MALRGDDRAVSSVIAAVLVFGFLVIALSLYQGFVVPDHNEEVEFKHSQRVANDMLDVRNGLLRTKSTGETSYVTVELGTSYPARVLAVNPPPASGTIRTTDLEPFTVENQTGADVSTVACPGEPSTRFLTYEASYNVYQGAPTFVYEHSVLYKQFPNGNVSMTGQTLVAGKTINLIPVKAAFSKSGVGAVSVDLRAGRLKSTTVTDPTVTVPTRLSESDWTALLAGQVDPSNVAVSNGNLTLTPDGKYTVRCGPVAVGTVPPGGARGTGKIGINPTGPDDVELRDAVLGSTSQDTIVRIDLNNTAANDTTIEEARISFFFDEQVSGGGTPTQAVIRNATTGVDSATLTVQGDTETLSPKIGLAGNFTETTVELEFDQSVTDSDFFVVQLTFESGETGTYFVAPRSP